MTNIATSCVVRRRQTPVLRRRCRRFCSASPRAQRRCAAVAGSGWAPRSRQASCGSAWWWRPVPVLWRTIECGQVSNQVGFGFTVRECASASAWATQPRRGGRRAHPPFDRLHDGAGCPKLLSACQGEVAGQGSAVRCARRAGDQSTQHQVHGLTRDEHGARKLRVGATVCTKEASSPRRRDAEAWLLAMPSAPPPIDRARGDQENPLEPGAHQGSAQVQLGER
ncbi:hypothetical protein SAMN05421854_108322 [Amycolatopsis rubida]|uniref:Uncharacterized protein n=1 Tax=Amycolatopsis rubida TaxID=112413 RepID=A0A1I5VEL3_9PSEU|nr:hypothetical protein SAMN05421854_108322 [Amycolatopsis rubida]